jgi:hypothetical protein
MNKRWGSVIIIVIILVFVSYIVFDVAFKEEKSRKSDSAKDSSLVPDNWYVSKIIEPGPGKLKAVAVTGDGNILLAGESFVACFDSSYKMMWNTTTDKPVTALATEGATIYAATYETILVLNSKGEVTEEWGPFEDKAIITSVTSNSGYVAFADAGNRIIMVLDKKGLVKSIIGKTGEQFVLPSAYFDVALGQNDTLYAANTGKRRVETRKTDGNLLTFFGEPGTAPGTFCGCCNPAHFAIIPQGFVTAEKGINRIKILNKKGDFVEFVSSLNKFISSIPLDIASRDGKVIYAANPADSKLYEFRRK